MLKIIKALGKCEHEKTLLFFLHIKLSSLFFSKLYRQTTFDEFLNRHVVNSTNKLVSPVINLAIDV